MQLIIFFSFSVVIHLASAAPLSDQLVDLQQEIRPLYKLSTCPYKRTSVQHAFETAGFKIDWCAFRVRDGHAKSPPPPAADEKPQRYQHHHQHQEPPPPPQHNDSDPNETPSTPSITNNNGPFAASSIFHQSDHAEPVVPMFRSDAPQRNYIDEIALTACVPLLMFTLLVAVLTMIVCLDQGKM